MQRSQDEKVQELLVLQEARAATQKEADGLRAGLREAEQAQVDTRRELQGLRRLVSPAALAPSPQGLPGGCRTPCPDWPLRACAFGASSRRALLRLMGSLWAPRTRLKPDGFSHAHDCSECQNPAARARHRDSWAPSQHTPHGARWQGLGSPGDTCSPRLGGRCRLSAGASPVSPCGLGFFLALLPRGSG